MAVEREKKDVERLKKLQDAHIRRLHILELLVARYGPTTLPHFLLEIEDIKQNLAQIRNDLISLGVGPNTDTNPYLGLNTFKEEDAHLFYGRKILINKLLDKIE